MESTAGDRPGRRRPSLEAYVALRLGRGASAQLRNVLARPLGAAAPSGFWRDWNPVYGYALLFYVYRPLRTRLPRPLAAWLTFVAAGFFLHDLVGWLLAGRARVPEMTLMFAVFGAESVLADALGLDLAAAPWLVRAAANLGHLALGWAAAAYLLVPLAERIGS